MHYFRDQGSTDPPGGLCFVLQQDTETGIEKKDKKLFRSDTKWLTGTKNIKQTDILPYA